MSVLSKSGLKLSACDINLYDWMFAKWHTIHTYFHAIYLLTRMSWSVGCLRPSIICCKVGVPTPNLPANSSISAEQWSSKSAVHSTQSEEKKDSSSNTQRPYSLVVERLQVHLFHMSINKSCWQRFVAIFTRKGRPTTKRTTYCEPVKTCR